LIPAAYQIGKLRMPVFGALKHQSGSWYSVASPSSRSRWRRSTLSVHFDNAQLNGKLRTVGQAFDIVPPNRRLFLS